ncbi:MAG: PilC/PilY family type IV pilus protein [Gammaproteobacteria bacterium]|nr:PilC/PilY family type IV pilus protein [Gammaproteobacteria bacterium]
MNSVMEQFKMKPCKITALYLAVYSLVLLFTLPVRAATLDISEVPITVGTSPNPNVMLLLDSSGSMNNLNWPSTYVPFDSNTQEWCGRNCTENDQWASDDDYIPIIDINGSGDDGESRRKAIVTDKNGDPKTITCNSPAGSSGGISVIGLNKDEDTFKCLYIPGKTNPEHAYTGDYLNWLFTYYGTAHSIETNTPADFIGTDVTKATPTTIDKVTIPTDRRVDSVKKIVADNIIPIEKVNFGLAKFNAEEGADIFAACSDEAGVKVTTSNIDTLLSTYSADGGTPLSEALYEITRYFRGMTPLYGASESILTTDNSDCGGGGGHGGGGFMGAMGMGGGGGTSHGDGDSCDADRFTSPIKYNCQDNFTIILTDGMATDITKWPTDAQDELLCGQANVTCDGSTPPDYDGLHPTEDDANPTKPPYKHNSDGHKTGTTSAIGRYIFTDDIAKFAYDIDMASSSSPLFGPEFDQAPFAKQNMKTLTISFGFDANVLKDAAMLGNGNTDISYKTDSSIDVPNHWNAKTSEDLQQALEEAMIEIKTQSTVSSASSVAANSGYQADGTALYQGKFRFIKEGDGFSENTWVGDVTMYPIKNDGSVETDEAKIKSAATVLNDRVLADSPRSIFTYNPTSETGIEFSVANFEADDNGMTTEQKGFLKNKFLINYIRGYRGCEVQNTPDDDANCTDGDVYSFRNRYSLLGTIVNSGPLLIPKPSSRYPDQWGSDSIESVGCPATSSDDASCYSTFKADKSDRSNVLYVGGNDGMLHAFDAGRPDNPLTDTDESRDATLDEKFAYIPNKIISKLGSYGDINYNHKYMVDATPTVIDAYDSTTNTWKTILVSGLNKGGQGVFALDVTNIGKDGQSFSAENVLWEFTDEDSAELGYTFSRPAVIRMHYTVSGKDVGRWVAVFGNGYNNSFADGRASTTGQAMLYFVDVFTGNLIKTIPTNYGFTKDPANPTVSDNDPNTYDASQSRPNGLSTVAPIDINNDLIVDYIYAGDVYGNMWRFDVSSGNTGHWAIYGKGTGTDRDKPIFVATHPSNSQSITSRPAVARAGYQGIMLYFGTGKYLGASDNLDTGSIQTFYGLLDNPEVSGGSVITRDTTIDVGSGETEPEMTPQTFTEHDVSFTHNSTIYTHKVREHSTAATTNNYRSWYVDLKASNAGATALGERIVYSPIVRGGFNKRVILTSIIPSAQSCTGGGTSWLMELDAKNGNKTSEPVFDLNADTKLDSYDNGVNDKVYNGWSHDGINSSPTIIVSDGVENKYMSSSSGNIVRITEALPSGSKGRQSWRQLK